MPTRAIEVKIHFFALNFFQDSPLIVKNSCALEVIYYKAANHEVVVSFDHNFLFALIGGNQEIHIKRLSHFFVGVNCYKDTKGMQK